MSDHGENVKYKWTPESTSLLVSVWGDKQVQKQLAYADGSRFIWESVARYMRKKGYAVSAKQCRSRMKQVLVCYREEKRAGTRAGVERYYEAIDKVLKSKKRGSTEGDNGFDTVDESAPFKSPPKDVKTSKNLKTRSNGYNEGTESPIRTEALSPIWHLAHEEEYPESPESNETVLAQPYRTFSPTRDAATNTLNARSQLTSRCTRRSAEEPQSRRDARSVENSVPNDRFGEMLYQNAVQNVQNQIIQESMRHRNYPWNERSENEEGGGGSTQPIQPYRRAIGNAAFRASDETGISKIRAGRYEVATTSNEAPASLEDPIRARNRLEQSCPIDNRAMPQEPRRGNSVDDSAMSRTRFEEPSGNAAFPGAPNNANETRGRSTADHHPGEIAVDLNEAFRRVTKNDGNQRFITETRYEEQRRPTESNEVLRAMNATVITNNATFNDDTVSIEFLEGSRSPSDDEADLAKSVRCNSDGTPSVPARKKKAQKLEQLVLNAITSQSEVVNKILAAQDAMVTRFLDMDRDRQNRLEDRLDHLTSVVHATVLNKSPEKEPSEPVITSLAPPPPPGAVPPKLDLVPPKPCRVPCTVASGNLRPINQSSVATRPGLVSPIKQPQPGSIWSKLGPVSQSPFVKAQQQLGVYRADASSNAQLRTQSSVERKIAREMETLSMDRRALIFETEKFLEMEKVTEEQAENAKIIAKMSQEVAARRKLFDSRAEPNPGIILSAAFLDAERRASSIDFDSRNVPVVSSNAGVAGVDDDDADGDDADDDDDDDLVLLAGQVENYERLRRLNPLRSVVEDDPCDTSTPARPVKPAMALNRARDEDLPRKQTIQQLARLVMKSARWRDAAAAAAAAAAVPVKPNERYPVNELAPPSALPSSRRNVPGPTSETAERQSRERAIGWLNERYCYGNRVGNDDRPTVHGERPGAPPTRKSYPMGFTMEHLNSERNERRVGFHPEDVPTTNPREQREIGFIDAIGSYPRRRQQQGHFYDDARTKYSSLPPLDKNMIDRYVHETVKREERDSDEDEEFLDTTTSMQPQPAKNSLLSDYASTGKTANCVVS